MAFAPLPRILSTLALMGLILSGCGGKPTVTPTISPSSTPARATATTAPTATVAAMHFPQVRIVPGELYFELDGQPMFLFSRNIAGYQQAHYSAFLEMAEKGGSRFVRIQLDSLGMGYTREGKADPNWLMQWDAVFSKAEDRGIYVLPVFSGWFDWNAGPGYSTWSSNPLNEANGGPVKDPAELFQKDSPTQALWLAWMQTVVQHWQGRPNIIAWEIFSEVNLSSGATEAEGVELVNRAAAAIRAADPSGRPVTASIAETGTWPNFYRDAQIEFINIHPYPPPGQLDREIVSKTRQYLEAYDKPVLIGESGLSADGPESSNGSLTVAKEAVTGVRHAIWASIVSGAMNGRALYWEDSFGIYFQTLGMPFMQKYETAELAAVQFLENVPSFAGMKPVKASSSPEIWGAMVGNEEMMIGWYRDAGSEPPEWPIRPVIAGAVVTVDAPGTSANWTVSFYDPKSGKQTGSAPLSQADGRFDIRLPDFTDDIAFTIIPAK